MFCSLGFGSLPPQAQSTHLALVEVLLQLLPGSMIPGLFFILLRSDSSNKWRDNVAPGQVYLFPLSFLFIRRYLLCFFAFQTPAPRHLSRCRFIWNSTRVVAPAALSQGICVPNSGTTALDLFSSLSLDCGSLQLLCSMSR